jgi:ethanolamine utilization protein EutN
MAGPGQVIYWVASREAALTLDPWFVPVDDAIVGLVDEVRLYPPEDSPQ